MLGCRFLIMENEYQYFVSYKWYGKTIDGFGSIQYNTNRKMDMELVRECEQDIIKLNAEIDKCIIINFQLFW